MFHVMSGTASNLGTGSGGVYPKGVYGWHAASTPGTVARHLIL